MLDVIGVGMNLHRVSVEDVEMLVAMLREHAEREEESFYPWLDAQIAARA